MGLPEGWGWVFPGAGREGTIRGGKEGEREDKAASMWPLLECACPLSLGSLTPAGLIQDIVLCIEGHL